MRLATLLDCLASQIARRESSVTSQITPMLGTGRIAGADPGDLGRDLNRSASRCTGPSPAAATSSRDLKRLRNIRSFAEEVPMRSLVRLDQLVERIGHRIAWGGRRCAVCRRDASARGCAVVRPAPRAA
jgi:hypothetical protein